MIYSLFFFSECDTPNKSYERKKMHFGNYYIVGIILAIVKICLGKNKTLQGRGTVKILHNSNVPQI